MSTATVIFHALYPDPSGPDVSAKPMVKIIYDVEFEGKLYSHFVASLELPSNADISSPLVSHDLPFICQNFERAVLAYYEFVLGPQGSLLSPSGPKGLLPRDNVFHVEWEVHLDMSADNSAAS